MNTCKKLITLALICAMPLSAAGKIAVVSFKECIEDSKMGKQEQNQLEALRKQLSSTLEGTERELQGIINKVQDPDYMDSLSEDGEEELKERYQGLMQERSNQQQQFMQIMQQAEYKTVQELNTQVARASQIVAKNGGYDYVLRDEAAFYFPADADVTKQVITEMDKVHDSEKENSQE